MLDRASSAESDWPVSGETQAVALKDAELFLKRRCWLIAGCVAGALALGLLYVLFSPSTYVATTQLLIEPTKQQALWQDNGLIDLTIDNAQVESQVQVLQSERIANSVVTKLGLINDPEFRGGATADDDRLHVALAHFASALGARRVGQSYVIEISFRSRDPEKAARIANAITTAYLQDQRDAKAEIAEQASRWLEARIAELGVQLNAAAAAAQEYRIAHGIVDTGSGGQSRLIDKLTELEAKAEAYKRIYENFLQKLTENLQQASYPVANARVITAASRPLVNSYPKTKLVLLLSILVGLLFGLALAAARSMLDATITSAKQVRDLLGLDCLGSLPAYREAVAGQPPVRRVEVLDAPSSPFSAGMHNIKISIENASRDKPSRCLGVLSLLPGQGASTLAINLAALFGASHSRTLLIDSDFRQRSLSEQLAPGALVGLVEALHDDRASAATFDPKTGAFVLPIADGETIGNSARLLGSPAMRRLLPGLKEQFATIIVDLPALSRTVDARVIAPLLDGCILVVAHGLTPLRAIEDAIERLRADNVALLGVVINRVYEGVPPLFGWYLDDLRETDYGGHIDRLKQAVGGYVDRLKQAMSR
jgi:Mrp family chromosome partitioning ATPase/capsular polysaccharide biosynthesis protein